MDKVQYLIPAALILDSEGKILFAKKSAARTEICIDKWELPGGTIKFGESVEEGLKRKIKEYFSVDIEIDKIIPYIHSYTAPGKLDGKEVEMQFFVIGIKSHIISGEIKPLKGKIKEYKYLSIEEYTSLPEDQRVPGDLEIINLST